MSATVARNRSAGRTVLNVLTNWGAVLFGMAITFVLSPFLVHHLGDARYGLWGVIGSIIGYLGLLDLGIRVGVTRFVARHEATGDREAANRLVSTALGLFGVIGAIAIVSGTLISLHLQRFAQTPGGYVHEASVAVFIASVTMGVSLVSGVYGASIAGLQRFDLLNTIDLTGEVLRATAMFYFVAHGGGLITLATIQLSVVSLRGIAYVFATHRLQPWLQVARRFYDPLTRREILSFSAYTFILHVSAMVLFSSDALVIAAIMPVTQVAFFVIAGNLSQVAMQVQSGVTRVIYPLISSRQASEGLGAASVLMRKSVRLSTIIVLPIVLTFLTRGPTFIGLWMGPAYTSTAGPILQVLALGMCIFMSYQVLTVSVMAVGLHKGLVPAYIAEAIMNLSLSVVLGKSMGVTGVAWGTIIPRLIMALGFAPWFCSRKLEVPARDYAMHAWVRPLTAMLPFAIVSYLIDRTWTAPNVFHFFGQVMITIPLAIAGTWIVGLEQDERERLRGWLRAGLARRMGGSLIDGQTVVR
jgi:O-antigen/teichoic acid export membrane protein